MVAGLSLVIVIFDIPFLIFVLLYGLAARVLTGPTLSPMGLLATRVLVPLIGIPEKPVPGPPKRFAQSVGLAFAIISALLYYMAGLELAAYGVLAVLIFFALMESIIGFCTGCFVFGYLMRWGLVPKETCEKCENLDFGR